MCNVVWTSYILSAFEKLTLILSELYHREKKHHSTMTNHILHLTYLILFWNMNAKVIWSKLKILDNNISTIQRRAYKGKITNEGANQVKKVIIFSKEGEWTFFYFHLNQRNSFYIIVCTSVSIKKKLSYIFGLETTPEYYLNLVSLEPLNQVLKKSA